MNYIRKCKRGSKSIYFNLYALYIIVLLLLVVPSPTTKPLKVKNQVSTPALPTRNTKLFRFSLYALKKTKENAPKPSIFTYRQS